MGALDAANHELIVHPSTTKRSTDFIALLAVLDSRYGPPPGRPTKPVVIVLDNGPIHTSKATTAAIAASVCHAVADTRQLQSMRLSNGLY